MSLNTERSIADSSAAFGFGMTVTLNTERRIADSSAAFGVGM